jgi:hypothetical protein
MRKRVRTISFLLRSLRRFTFPLFTSKNCSVFSITSKATGNEKSRFDFG